MSMEGKLVARGGKMYVLYETTQYGTPEMVRLWWPVQQWQRDPYSANSPQVGDAVRYADQGWWHVTSRPSGGNVSTGSGSTDAEFREEVPVPRPKVRGNIEVRWYQGRWEKLLKTGWKPVGTGAGSGGGKRRHGKSRTEFGGDGRCLNCGRPYREHKAGGPYIEEHCPGASDPNQQYMSPSVELADAGSHFYGWSEKRVAGHYKALRSKKRPSVGAQVTELNKLLRK
jgi:hypothetical protein